MWLKILKYAAKIAVATGLADKVKAWIKKKLDGKEEKLTKKVEKITSAIDEVHKELGTESAFSLNRRAEGQEYAHTDR